MTTPRRIAVIPPSRSMHLDPSGPGAYCIVETIPGTAGALVEVRNVVEALALIGALVVAYELPALPPSFAATLKAAKVAK